MCGAGAHQFTGPVHSGWTIASFQYDHSLYSTPLHGMTWRHVWGGFGKCRLPWNTWDRWWVGCLHLLPLQRHGVPFLPVAAFPQATSACLRTCLCIQAAFSARLIGTVTEEWLRVIRKQALCKMKITLQEVKELAQGQVACKCRAGVGTGIF